MSMSVRWAYLKDVHRLHGLREMLVTAWVGGLYKGSKRLMLVSLNNPKPMPKAVEAAKNHRFFFAGPEDLVRFQQNQANQIAEIDIERVKSDIARCLVQLDGDVLTGYAWVWMSKLAYIADGVYINLPVSTIYNYKAYTNPDYRGLGFQGLRHLKLLELLELEGVTSLFGFVDRLNTKSLHGVKKSGYQVIGELIIRHNKGRVLTRLNLPEWFWPGKEAG
jgi:hypothetical protein